jgi:hypothetical protein
MVGAMNRGGSEGDFRGSVEKAMEQMAERDSPTVQEEESEDSRVARERYELEQSELRDIEREADKLSVEAALRLAESNWVEEVAGSSPARPIGSRAPPQAQGCRTQR